MRITVELGLDAQHKFTALRLRWDANLGAYVLLELVRLAWSATSGVAQPASIISRRCMQRLAAF